MTAIVRIDFSALALETKNTLTAVCKELGLRRDWCPINKPEILLMIRGFGPSAIIDAARRTGEFPEARLAELVLDGESFDEDDAAEDSTATATVTVTEASAPDVSHVAGLLAQLLASNKAGVDADGVRKIVDPMLDGVTRDLLDTVSGWVQETKDLIANMPPKEILVRSERAEVKMDGLQHHRFERLLRACSARQPDGHRLNVYLYGAPGTGKTTAARNVAKALGLPFHCNGAISTKYELTGFIDANGVCHSPEFRKAWQHGGVYLYDEIDGSMAQAIVAFNAALANGVMAFPDGMVERHADCVVIAAANTVNGATAEFTGRTKLDAASLDRFVFIEWGIDDKLEEAAAGDRADWLREVRRVRRVTAEKGIKVLISPRATIYGVSLLAAGMGFDEVREMALRKGMNDAQWAMVA
jgi:DNA polymerase III delta prime subunit